MADKILKLNVQTSGLVNNYARVKHPTADTYLLTPATGAFAARPLTFPPVTEDANDKKKYKLVIAGALADGIYPWEFFHQVGAAQDEANDTFLGDGELEIEDGIEVTLGSRSKPAIGNRLVTLTFYLTATVTPIQGIEVDIWNNGQTVKQNGQPLTTDANGQITVSLNDGTYKVRPRKQGYTFTVPETLTVSGNTSQTYYGNTIDIGAPLAANACRVYEYCFMPDDQTPMATVKAKAKIVGLPYDYNGKYHSGQEIDGTYNAVTGVVYWDLVWGSRVEFFIRDIHEEEVTKVIPSEVEKRLEDIA